MHGAPAPNGRCGGAAWSTLRLRTGRLLFCGGLGGLQLVQVVDLSLKLVDIDVLALRRVGDDADHSHVGVIEVLGNQRSLAGAQRGLVELLISGDRGDCHSNSQNDGKNADNDDALALSALLQAREGEDHSDDREQDGSAAADHTEEQRGT